MARRLLRLARSCYIIRLFRVENSSKQKWVMQNAEDYIIYEISILRTSTLLTIYSDALIADHQEVFVDNRRTQTLVENMQNEFLLYLI